MHPKSPKSLEGIRNAAQFIIRVSDGKGYSDYVSDLLLRSAIERNIEIIGESLMRLERTDPLQCGQISDYRKIIGLRHRLAHGYDTEIDHRIVWEIVQESLPVLLGEVIGLLSGTDQQ